ncbi:MAG TPA: RNA polymerase sigma factor [Kofleriaceae bacterium]|nr:RNA polymerase sigma factor [Kofleriaceae bacterium]
MSVAAPAPDADDLAEVARRAIAGDAAAFRRVIELTSGRLYRVAVHICGDRDDADDAVQEAFIRAWQRMGELRDPGAAVGWLIRIVQNAAKDRLRARKRAPAAQPSGEARRPDDALAGAQQDAVVKRAVMALSEKHRVVLLLHEVDGMTAAEIGALLGIATGTVESRLSRARAGLAKRLAREVAR